MGTIGNFVEKALIESFSSLFFGDKNKNRKKDNKSGKKENVQIQGSEQQSMKDGVNLHGKVGKQNVKINSKENVGKKNNTSSNMKENDEYENIKKDNIDTSQVNITALQNQLHSQCEMFCSILNDLLGLCKDEEEFEDLFISNLNLNLPKGHLSLK